MIKFNTYKNKSTMDKVKSLVNKAPFKARTIIITRDRFDLLEEIKLSDDKNFSINLEDGMYNVLYKDIPIVSKNSASEMYVQNY